MMDKDIKKIEWRDKKRSMQSEDANGHLRTVDGNVEEKIILIIDKLNEIIDDINKIKEKINK